MMEESADIGQQRRTLGLELLRSVPQGLIETAGSTFAMYVAVTVFDVPVWMRMLIAAAASVGLLLSLFTVQMVRRVGCSVNAALALVWCLAAGGFGLAAMSGGSERWYVAGVCLAAVMLMLGVPLIAQVYRKHYSNRVRGRLFAIAGVVRAATGAYAGYLLGSWLARQESDFHGLFWVYASAALLMAGCVMGMARVRLSKVGRLRMFDAFGHVARDRAFRKMLGVQYLLGTGNLLCFALFVEFISNPEYGFALDPKEAALITTTIPMVVFIVCVVPWGWVFDRVPFFRMRLIVNLFFFAGILVYFLGGNYISLCIGIGLHGVARSGGNILWNLWVTKFAPEEHVGEYMSVHTCLTGLRGSLAPVFAFIIAGTVGPEVVAVLGAALIFVASVMLWPEVRQEWREE